jgi:hypothetical protein
VAIRAEPASKLREILLEVVGSCQRAERGIRFCALFCARGPKLAQNHFLVGSAQITGAALI